MDERQFDVALSFAGEDRTYVHKVATNLRDRGIAVFYDEFSTVELWGRDLYLYLDDIYRNQCRYAVVFTSASYARGMWTSHERQSIQARLMAEAGQFLLPVRLDDTDIAGFRPNIGYLDGQRLTAEIVADHIVAKVGGDRTGIDPSTGTVRVPLTENERRRVLAIRPAGWEHLILAGTVWQEWERLEAKRLDHELGFAAGTGQYVSGEQLSRFLGTAMDELTSLVSKLDRLVSGDRLIWAMGVAGTAGDAVRIQHLGRRFGLGFEDLLDWAARIHNTVCDPRFRRVLDLLARLVDEPVTSLSGFVNALVVAAGEIADAASAGRADDLRLTVTLNLDIANATIEAFHAEVADLVDHRGQ